jgi:hypothetical protein
MIKIKSKKAGFRRCGVVHPAEFVEYPDGRFSKAEIAALRADPMLIVETVEVPPPIVKSYAKQPEPEQTDVKKAESVRIRSKK